MGGGGTTLFGHTFLSLFIAPPPHLTKINERSLITSYYCESFIGLIHNYQ